MASRDNSRAIAAKQRRILGGYVLASHRNAGIVSMLGEIVMLKSFIPRATMFAPMPLVAQTLADGRAAFGARESAINLDLSPDGNQVVYIAPLLRELGCGDL